MSFFRKKSLFILLIGMMLLVVFVGYSLSDRDEVSRGEKILLDSVGWVQNVFHRPVNAVIGFFGDIGDLKNTYSENKVLKEKLAEYKTLVYEVQEIEKENKELRKMLEINESSRDFEPIIAHVISRSPERWLEQLTINRGSQHGIEMNMAVMTVDGMIGKVNAVSPTKSTVQLITGFDQLSRISATISRKKGNNIFGLIEGYDKEKKALIYRIIEESNKNVKEGELVVSSEKGGVFPEGLPIGTIKELSPDEYGLTKTAYIEPAANLFEIDQVIVVDRNLPTHDESAEEEAQE